MEQNTPCPPQKITALSTSTKKQGSYCTAEHNTYWQAKILQSYHRWESGSIKEGCVIYPSPCSISVTELEIETSPIKDTTSRGMTGASWSSVPKHVQTRTWA